VKLPVALALEFSEIGLSHSIHQCVFESGEVALGLPVLLQQSSSTPSGHDRWRLLLQAFE